MAVSEAVVSVVLHKLTDMLKAQSITQNTLIVYEVQEIMKSLNLMRDLMKSINHKAQDYLDDVYMVEDKVEKFTLHVVCRKKVFGFLTNHIFIFSNLKSCKNIHQKIKKIVTHLMELKGQQRYVKPTIKESADKDKSDDETVDGNHETISVSHAEKLSFSYSCNEEAMQIVGIKDRFQQTKQRASFSYREKEMDIFGLKEDVKTLVNRLTNDSEHVFSIVGQRGIGKTTLARAIYKHKDIKKHFQFRAWVSMLADYSTKDVLLNLLKAIDSMTFKTNNMEDEKEMKLKLGMYLTNKRYLVVLDGANTCHIAEDLKEIFPDGKNGSKLVLTSSKTIETIQPSISLPCMNPLNEVESLKMLKEMIGEEKNWDLLPEKTKWAILETCKGLPVNIILFARLLSIRNPSSWHQVFSHMKNSESVLSLCYDDLSDDLKVCLLYLVLFPKEFDIPVRRLLRLWLAEGFVKENSTQEFKEDIAQIYFEELVNRNMIQISKLRSDNSPRGCRVLGPLHDYLLPKARETYLFYTYSNLLDSEKVGSLNIRRLVEYETPKKEQGTDKSEITEKENATYPSTSYLSSSTPGESKTKKQFEIEMSNLSSPKKTQPKSYVFNPSNLRSYISFNHQKTDYKQAKQIGSFLGNIINDGFGLLRVLDLEGVYKPILPENLGNLCNLRYLGLRLTYLDSLPESVGELTHLETLDLKHTCIDELPDSIWRLKKLHHLNLNEMYLNVKLQFSLRLLTLWGLFLDKKVPIKDGLDKLRDLRELGITFLLDTNQEDLLNWIANLRDLRSLRLRSKDDLGRPSKLMFKSMSNLGQLSHLNLLGNLEKLPYQNEFPPTLKVLTLSISLLKQDPMKTLGQLPCLTVLRLLGQSYIGKEMVCRKGWFSKLRELKMWMLKELESWLVEEGSMQSLKHLDIRCCEKLQTIPNTLLQQNQLEKLVLTSMPHAFIAEVEQLKSEHTSLTINHWKFPPLPWEQKDSTLVYRG